MAPELHPAPLKALVRLRFRELSEADRDTYRDVLDPHALIAYSKDQTWIIEGDMLRIVTVHQDEMQAHQQFFALEPWGDPRPAF